MLIVNEAYIPGTEDRRTDLPRREYKFDRLKSGQCLYIYVSQLSREVNMAESALYRYVKKNKLNISDFKFKVIESQLLIKIYKL